MSFNLSWTIEGETQLSRNLLLLAEKVKDWTPAFEQTAYELKSTFQNEVFDTEGGAIEESWAPLSKAYAYAKAKKYPGKGILERTGTMRNSFMTLWRPDMAAVWNDCEYFKYHQSNQPRHVLPRRVMIKLAEAQRMQVVRIFTTYFSEVVHK
jgi:phage gpG-like protein